jgi:hypothetical protein
VLNNNEKYPILANSVVGIPNTLVNPNDFRRKYDRIFSEDLIERATTDNSIQEFLV